ncbi:unnamed protein product [Echinostoma caproni]|uniref:Nudix hydrolase domain-containing protein n=1 Tax=Echinostoma caproni TaxID=27848 RepID=A0A183A7W5_9TREM|nr:unnamed protein product [Echinostoma caproni]
MKQKYFPELKYSLPTNNDDVRSVSYENQSWLLLGLKQRGFGQGRWNGFGGKVQSDDRSPKHAALRELQEESGLEVSMDQVEEVGRLWFTFDGKEECMEVHLFMCRDWKPSVAGNTSWPCHTEEMHPCWFPIGQMAPNREKPSCLDLSRIPFKNMWPDDRIWLHRVLSNDQVLGWVHCVPLSSTEAAKSGLLADCATETNGLSISPFEIPVYRLQLFPNQYETDNVAERLRLIESVTDQLGFVSNVRLRDWMKSGVDEESTWRSKMIVFE